VDGDVDQEGLTVPVMLVRRAGADAGASGRPGERDPADPGLLDDVDGRRAQGSWQVPVVVPGAGRPL
jgi:hypothetical protein